MGMYKKYFLRISVYSKQSFLLFLFSTYNVIDIIDICKSLNISIGTVMNNPKMLKFVPDPLKTKKMCNHTVKKSHYLISYVPDQYKTQ